MCSSVDILWLVILLASSWFLGMLTVVVHVTHLNCLHIWFVTHSQETSIHVPGGIRTHNVSRRTAAELRPRPRGHWDRQWLVYKNLIYEGGGIEGMRGGRSCSPGNQREM